MIALATGALVVGSGVAGPTGAIAAGSPSHADEGTSNPAAPAGTASPGQVRDAMERLGMSVLDTPVTSLLSGDGRVAATQRASAIECNSNYCVWVKPQVKGQIAPTGAAHEAQQLLDNVRKAGPTTLASLLTEMDRVVSPGEPWSVVRGAGGSYLVS